jgi:phosphatidylserine/phosphatidylglycerophosphate/cardiolipin synthase-like enzyme
LGQQLSRLILIHFLIQFTTSTLLAGTRVYFNQDDRVSYIDPYRQIERQGHNFEQILVDFIHTAEHSVDVAVQEFRLASIANALVERHKQGVEIRVIIDNSYNTLMPTKDLDELGPHIISESAIDILTKNGISLSDDTSDGSSGRGLMHHKFVIVDKQRLAVTSANFTLRDFHGAPNSRLSLGNANALMVINDAPISEVFLEEFNIMFGADSLNAPRRPSFGQRKPYRGAQPVSLPKNKQFRIQFSPTSRTLPEKDNTIGLILDEVKQTRNTLRMALFVFSDQSIADTIKKLKANHGIRLSVLIERMFAFRDYSKAMDFLGLKLLSPSCQYPAGINPWPQPAERVGIAQTWGTDKLHHKFAVIDNDTVVFGSKNWTAAATFNNDETLMVIKDPSVAREFSRELDRLEYDAHWGPLPWVLERIQEREEMCADQLAS